MSNLNVSALKRLFPKNTTRRQGGKVSGANRKRVQVMLPPDTLARLDELIEHDEQARSAAVTLGVEVLWTILYDGNDAMVGSRLVEMLDQTAPHDFIFSGLAWLTDIADHQP